MADLTVGSGGTYSTIGAAIAAAATGDRVLVLNTHSESLSASLNITLSTATFPVNSPLQILSVDNFSTPTLTTGGSYSWTGNYSITFNGNFYFHGIGFIYSGVSSTPSLLLGTSVSSSSITLESCNIAIESTHVSARPLRLGSIMGASANDSYRTKINNCSVSFGSSAQSIEVGSGNHSISNIALAGAAVPSALLSGTQSTGLSNIYLDASDLSSKALGSLMNGASLGQTKLFVNRVKIHATTAAAPLGSGTIDPFNELTAVNMSTGDTSIAFQYISGSGNVIADSTVKAVTDPITDSGVQLSRKMTASASAGQGAPLRTEFLLPVADNATVTPYVEILSDSALKTKWFWIDAQAMTTDGTTIGVKYTTHPGMLDAGTTDCAVGTETYTGSALTNKYRIELAAPITVRQDSFVKITVNLANPSTVVYVGAYGG